MRRCFPIGLVTIATLVSIALARVAAAAAPPECDAAAIAVRLDPSTSGGGILAIRNVGSTACEIERVPRLELRDASGAVISTGRPPAMRFVHPGPELVPLVLEPGRVAATTLRWPIGLGRARMRGTGGGTATALAVLPGTGERALAVRVDVPTDDDAIVFDESWLTTELARLDDPSSPTAGAYTSEGPAGSVARVGDALRGILRMRAAGSGRLAFTLDATGGDDRAPNVGSLAGTFVVDGTHATFSDPARACALALDAYGDRVVVTQTGTCGFGYAVTASGQYRRHDVVPRGARPDEPEARSGAATRRNARSFGVGSQRVYGVPASDGTLAARRDGRPRQAHAYRSDGGPPRA